MHPLSPDPFLKGAAPPVPKAFQGRHVELAPLSPPKDAAELHAISHTDAAALDLWRYLPWGPFETVAGYEEHLREWTSRPGVLAFVVRGAIDHQMLGSLSLMNIHPGHGTAELGYIWYRPAARRTPANTEACHLLLRHCFEDLGYRRMEWKCDARNAASQRAALRLGFTAEGIFRQHQIVKGRNRDTAWFSLLDHEWPAVGPAMARWLDDPSGPSLGERLQESRPSA